MKVGRAVCDSLNGAQLRREMLSQSYNLLRIKINAADHLAIHELEQTGLNYFHAGAIIEYHLPLNQIKKRKPKHTLDYQLYDGSQGDELKKLISKCCSHDPIGYYKTPGLSKIIDKSLEIKLLQAYYSNFKGTNERRLFLIRHQDHLIGFIAHELSNDELYTPLASVLPEFRGQGFFRDIITGRSQFSLEHQIANSRCGARIENIQSQQLFEEDGMTKETVYSVFHILNST